MLHTSNCDMISVFFLQLMSQYPSLYSPAHSESGKWDALVKASESLLKEKEMIIERQVFCHCSILSSTLIEVAFP